MKADLRQLLHRVFLTVSLPLIVKWVATMERRILREGVRLSEEEMLDARALGVRNPERVRLLAFGGSGTSRGLFLKSAETALKGFTPTTRGMSLRHGILVRRDCWRDRGLIAHELAHTEQYERLGGLKAFLRRYLAECLTHGYPAAPLEEEAKLAAGRLRREDLA